MNVSFRKIASRMALFALVIASAAPIVAAPNSRAAVAPSGDGAFVGDDGRAMNPQQEILKGITIVQKLNEQVPLDTPFVDSTGKSIVLGDVFSDRPVVLALVYHECPQLCNQVLNGLLTTLRGIDYTVGEDFDVLVVSFDPKETPELAADRKRGFNRLYGREGTEAGWHFLTGEEKNIRRLADAVGFEYAWDEERAQYAHASGIMVLTPQGKVSKYFYGIDYNTRDVRLGIVDASKGQIGSMVDAILLLCYHYDPLTGKYGLVISRVMQVGGLITLLCLGGFVMLSLRGERRQRFLKGSPGAAVGS